jgi:cell division protein FtsB
MRWILILLLFMLAALQYRLWIGPGSWADVTALERDLVEQQILNERLRKRNKVLEREIKDLKTGLSGVEERARSELGLIKEGETLYLIDEGDK